jgi:hypothetical protein
MEELTGMQKFQRAERIKIIANSNVRINDKVIKELLKYRREVCRKWCEGGSLEVREALEDLLDYTEKQIKKYLYL